MNQVPRHVVLGGDTFRIDVDAEVPYRRWWRSVMVPRADISGVPGAINLQRDVWLWSMSDFQGGEGRLVFDSSDPVGPPAFYRSTGGIDTRTPGQFTLHPDSNLVFNQTGAGGSGPTNTTWTNTDFSTVSGSPSYSDGSNSDHVTLHVGDKIQTPARTATTGDTTQIQVRFVHARTTKDNKAVDVKLTVRNTTDSTNTTSATATVRDEETVTLTASYSPVTGKTYRYYIENNDGGSGVTVKVKYAKESRYGGGTAAPQDIREMRLGIGNDVWALAYDGTNTDVLKWNFSTDAWDQIVANMHASAPRGLTGSDQYMYALQSTGRVYRINNSGATYYAAPPDTSGTGEPFGICVAANKLFVLHQQALVQLTLDATSGLPLDETDTPSDYQLLGTVGEFPKELSPDTTLRRRMSATSNGVRFFVNVAGEQTVIYECVADGALTPIHQLPLGYTATAIRHYANITFIATKYVNVASEPSVTKAAIYYISSDNLLRNLGELRQWDTNNQAVTDITAYGHDVYFLQGRRVWRYSLGQGGITLENEVGAADETKSRALVVMDQKFWAAVEGQGTFVTDDEYSRETCYLESPTWDFDLPDLDKVLLSFDVLLEQLPSNCRVDFEYKADDASTWTTLTALTTAATTKHSFTVSSSSSTVTFRNLQWRIGLTSLDGVSTPTIKSINARVYVLDYEKYFEMTLLADDESSSDRGSDQISGHKKMTKLATTINNKQLTTLTTYFEGSPKDPTQSDTYTVVLTDPFFDVSDQGQASMRLKATVVPGA